MMGGRFGGGMMAGYGRQGSEGPLHEYMVAAFAPAFNLTAETLEARLDAGETLSAAVAAGVITQEQAEFMLSHWEQMWASDYGPGSGNCGGMGRGGRGGGMRWNTQPAP